MTPVATTIPTTIPILTRLAGGRGHLAELGGRKGVVQQRATRLLVLIVVLGIDQRGCGRGLLVGRRHGRRIKGAQVAGDGGGTSSSPHAAAHANAALVHQVVGLHAVLQVGRGAPRCRLRAVVHSENINILEKYSYTTVFFMGKNGIPTLVKNTLFLVVFLS